MTQLIESFTGELSRPTRELRRTGNTHRIGLAAVVMALGVLVISLAYAAGRGGASGQPWTGAYWIGEVLLFGPVVWRLLCRKGPSEYEAAGLVLGLAGGTYLVKYLYSPLRFGFPDEFQHWRSTTTLLESHHLFGVNHLLPVSPAYPGLQEVTSALVTTTGLPIFAAGMIIAGLAHLLLAASLYVVFRRVSGSARAAGLACTIYAVNPHFQVFDAIFGYQTLALAFLGLALVAALALAKPPERENRIRPWVLAAVLVAATVVTHHITSYVLAGTLILLACFVSAYRHRRNRRGADLRDTGAARLGVLAGITVGMVGLWLGLIAPLTVQYLEPTARHFFAGLANTLTAQASDSGTTPTGPLPDLMANYATAILIGLGVLAGWRHIWRTQRHHVWALAFAVSAVGYYVILILRLATPDGAEIAGRSLTYLYIPIGYTLAMALVWLSQISWRRARHAALGRAQTVLAGSVVILLLFGGIAAGWPPYWERLPGHYIVDGFESGINDQSTAVAKWAASTLGPDHRVAADFTNYILLGSYGDQDVVRGVNQLYYHPTYTGADAELARQDAVTYVVVDLRTSRYKPPPAQGYFPARSTSPNAPVPIPRANLLKFGNLPGADRVYDSGDIILYKLPGTHHAK